MAAAHIAPRGDAPAAAAAPTLKSTFRVQLSFRPLASDCQKRKKKPDWSAHQRARARDWSPQTGPSMEPSMRRRSSADPLRSTAQPPHSSCPSHQPGSASSPALPRPSPALATAAHTLSHAPTLSCPACTSAVPRKRPALPTVAQPAGAACSTRHQHPPRGKAGATCQEEGRGAHCTDWPHRLARTDQPTDRPYRPTGPTDGAPPTAPTDRTDRPY